MQSPKEYLQEKIGPCIQHLFQHYLPSQDFKSIHDLFNVTKCYKLLMCILREQVKSKLPDLRLYDQAQNQTYNEMRKRNFQRIYEIIQQSYDVLGWDMVKRLEERDIGRMIDKGDVGVMVVFMQYVTVLLLYRKYFQLLKDNTSVVSFITTLDQSIQRNVMQVMQNSQSTTYHHQQHPTFSPSLPTSRSRKSSLIPSRTSLQNNNNDNSHTTDQQLQQMQLHLQKMQSHLQLREEEMKELKCVKEMVEEELEECRRELEMKREEVESLKKRMVSYEEVDQLLVEKDEEIARLDKRLTQYQLRSRLKQSQLTAQNRTLHQKLLQLDTKQSQLTIKFQKQKSFIQNLTKQKDQAQLSMKKVINNLKQKNKSLMERVGDLQNQLIEVRFEKEMKEKELNQMRVNVEGRRENFPQMNSPRSPLHHEDLHASVGSVTGGNYSRLGEQLSIELDRIDIEDELGLAPRSSQNKRFNQLLQQNYSLKQQLQKLQSSGFSDSKQFKQLQDEIQKMKKKINILKRRNDEIENQHKEEVDIMVGILDNCYSQSFGKVK